MLKTLVPHQNAKLQGSENFSIEEIWKPVTITKYSKYYLVSSKGRIKATPCTRKQFHRKLTPAQKHTIKRMYGTGLYTKAELGRRFGVRYQAITYAVRYKPSKLKERILKQSTDSDGYKVVGLCRTAGLQTLKVHRLVALAFVPNPQNKPEVNHKDGNKQNNHDWNLEWVTNPEHNQHKIDNGQVKGSNNGNAKLTEFEVRQIRASSKTQKELAHRFGVSIAMIQKIIHRNNWTHC